MQQYTAIVKQEGAWWYGWVEEIPGVNCQEKDKECLLESLRETLVEAIEINKEEALRFVTGSYTEESIAVYRSQTAFM